MEPTLHNIRLALSTHDVHNMLREHEMCCVTIGETHEQQLEAIYQIAIDDYPHRLFFYFGFYLDGTPFVEGMADAFNDLDMSLSTQDAIVDAVSTIGEKLQVYLEKWFTAEPKFQPGQWVLCHNGNVRKINSAERLADGNFWYVLTYPDGVLAMDMYAEHRINPLPPK